MEIKLNKTLYSEELVQDGVEAFSEHASFELNEDAEYWQLGYEAFTLIPIAIGTLVILVLFNKRRRRN